MKKCRPKVSANHTARINLFLSNTMHEFHLVQIGAKIVTYIPAPLKTHCGIDSKTDFDYDFSY